MRSAFALALAAASFLAPAAALAQSPTTTRIETRPFYGATVTLEEGVRVFRPLPPHQRVIINPGGKTPLSLGFEEKHAVSHNYHYGDGTSSGPAYVGGVDGGWAVPHRGYGARRGGHGRGGVLSPGGRSHGGGHGGHR
ncbi:MAG: hypothetical protein R3D44_02740 [Hyphomicrobiaceae bacterium]